MKFKRICLLFLIRSLNRGGAERQLVELVKGLDKQRFAIVVVTFYGGGDLGLELEKLEGVEVFSLGKRSRWDLLPFLLRLRKLVFRLKPQIIHGYLGVANELGLLFGKLKGAKVVLGLRASNVDFSQYDWPTALSFRVGAWLSRFADLIIINSQAGKYHHLEQGYNDSRMVVVNNGIDVAHFRPDLAGGQKLRTKWGITLQQSLIGLVGRIDPMKDHSTFFQAAALLSPEHDEARFVCVGEGSQEYQAKLYALVDQLGLDDKVIWAGLQRDMVAVYSALDVATSSSYGEGFSNVVGEAMACEMPCVVTDVGDSAYIVGNTGVVVPPKNPEALAKGWKKILQFSQSERENMGQAARARIAANFTVKHLVSRTEAVLLKLLD